jgi:hypothetical protein
MFSQFKDSSQDKGRDLAAVMARVYGACPACGASSVDHDIWELASARPTDPDSQFATLTGAIASRDWRLASTIREFRATDDAIVYLFLRCPRSTDIALLRLESFVEMWFDDRVTDRWMLSREEVQAANAAAGDQWRKVGEHRSPPDV